MRKKNLIILLCFAFIGFIFANSNFIYDNLNEDEKIYLLSKPKIKIDVIDFKPLTGVDNEGLYTGFTWLIFKQMLQSLDIDYELIHHETWLESQKALKNNEIDIIPTYTSINDKVDKFHKTQVYFDEPLAYVVSDKMLSVNSLSELNGKRVSVIYDSFIDLYIRENYPMIERILCDSELACLQTVIDYESDATFAPTIADSYLVHLFNKNRKDNNYLKIGGKVKEFSFSISMATSKDNKILRDIFQKALDSITSDEMEKLKQKFRLIFSLDPNRRLEPFTSYEKSYLKENSVIKVAVRRDWAPYEYRDENGKNIGIINELLNVIADTLGITFEKIPVNQNEEIDDIKKQKDVKLFSSRVSTKKHIEDFEYTDILFDTQCVLLTKLDIPTIYGFLVRHDLKLVVLDNDEIINVLSGNKDNYQIVKVKTTDEAIKKVLNSEADAFFCTQLTALPIINSPIKSKIKINNIVKNHDLKLRLAVDKDDIVLADIINKAISRIPFEKKSQIVEKYTYHELQRKVNYKLFSIILLSSLTLIMILILWIRRLRRLNQIIDDTSKKYTRLANHLQDAIFEFNTKEREFTYISPSFREMFELDKTGNITIDYLKDIKTTKFSKTISILQQSLRKYEKTLIHGEKSINFEDSYILPSGKDLIVSFNIQFGLENVNNIIYIYGIGRDVTEKNKYMLELKEKNNLNIIINRISTSFVINSTEKFFESLKNMLKLIGNFFNSDAAYVMTETKKWLH